MTDHFALLNEPRRPWLDAAALKAKFLARSAEVHPDRVHQSPEADKLAANQRYTELNAAYNCLREPRHRIRHLLELELGAKPSDLTNVPDDLMEVFFSVGKVFREVDALLVEKGRATSPLLQVQFFERGQDWVEKLGALREKISVRRDVLVGELQAVDAGWETATLKPTDVLLRIWRLLSFYDRWLTQIQERVVQLSF
jgi:curved DNA-binding protein CbpA